MNPYGFIGKLQGSPGSLDTPDALASGVVDLLLKHKTTAATMREALIVGLEKSPSFAASKAIASKMELLKYYISEQLTRMEAAWKDNVQLEQLFGVPERIQRVIQRLKPSTPEETAF